MFGAYYFGWPYWADSPSVVVVPPVPTPSPTYTYQTLVVPCRVRICSDVTGRTMPDDFSLSRLQEIFQAIEPVPLVECRTRRCEEITGISDSNDLQIYNLQDALFFNGTPLSIAVTCPPGYQCSSLSGTLVFTYPPGTFQFPVPQTNGRFPIALSLRGCMTSATFNSTGSTFTGTITLQSTGCVVGITLPAGSSFAAQQAAANEIIAEVARQQAYCDAAAQIGPGGQWPQNPAPPPPLPAVVFEAFQFPGAPGASLGTIASGGSLVVDLYAVVFQNQIVILCPANATGYNVKIDCLLTFDGGGNGVQSAGYGAFGLNDWIPVTVGPSGTVASGTRAIPPATAVYACIDSGSLAVVTFNSLTVTVTVVP